MLKKINFSISHCFVIFSKPFSFIVINPGKNSAEKHFNQLTHFLIMFKTIDEQNVKIECLVEKLLKQTAV